MQSP
jgi:transcriptional regulator with XRE-family HTH domain